MTVTEERAVVRDALVEHRREFRLAFDELKQATRELADPRDPIREHPTRWLVGALVAGFLLGWRR
jgi:MYXO-CTERM domain-containing protein